MKIVIAGIGGVGGYFGGLLAKHFQDNDAVQVAFIARGEYLEAIRNNGLKVIKGDTEFITRPAFATADPSEIGIADVVVISTKTYDLDSMIGQLKPCIDLHTMILPLLNGVDNRDRILHHLPGHIVLHGCVYLVSRILKPGVIHNSGNIETLYFGLEHYPEDRMLSLGQVLRQSGIQAYYAKNISGIIWEKFIFISPIATATSFYDCSIGDVLRDEERTYALNALIDELIQIAIATGIDLPPGVFKKTIHRLHGILPEATTSMHRDFQKHGSRTELETLSGFVVRDGLRLGADTPFYEMMYNTLKERRTLQNQ